MRFFFKSKDGGAESNVTGYWLIESKSLFSIVLLRFDIGSREAFHTHAFNAISWVLTGGLREVVHGSDKAVFMFPSWKPIYTPRERFHRVFGLFTTTWAISIRGPWKNIWKEYLPNLKKYVTLTHGRKEI